jgi:hypothetical protein
MTRVLYSLCFWGVLNRRISFVYYFNDFFVFFVQTNFLNTIFTILLKFLFHKYFPFDKKTKNTYTKG